MYAVAAERFSLKEVQKEAVIQVLLEEDRQREIFHDFMTDEVLLRVD